MWTMAAVHPPNHHADHPGFSGFSGLAAAVRFLSGRERAADVAIELAGLGSGDRLVDIGCGPGVAAARARKLGARVVGVDPSTVMLNVGRLRWLRSGIRWRDGTAESLPVPDSSTDVVWSLATVHHWADLDAGLDEVVRVLSPAGRLVALERRITDPAAEGRESHGWTPEQAEAFAAMCEAHGFVDVEASTHPGEPTLVAVTASIPR